MRPQILAVCLVPVALAAAFVACGGTSVSGNTNPLASREPAGSSLESPNGGEEPAQSTDEPPGTTNGGTNGTLPICMNPPAAIVACEACLGLSCGSVLSPAVASCSAFLACFHNCACSDDTCIANCAGTVTSACETAATPLGTCIQNSCETQCGDIDLGLSGGDGGTTTSTGATGNGGTGTTGTTSCSTLSGCCSALPSGEASACEATATNGNEAVCQSELSTFQNAGICN